MTFRLSVGLSIVFIWLLEVRKSSCCLNEENERKNREPVEVG